MGTPSLDSFQCKSTLRHNGKEYTYYSIPTFLKNSKNQDRKLPYSLQILLENLLRREDKNSVKDTDILALAQWDPKAKPNKEIQFMPSRVLLQDFTGVPCVADLAAMRGALKALGGNPEKINPLQPADLVIDHSVQVDEFGSSSAFEKNAEIEFQRNQERYQFLKWGQEAFQNFRVVPPETGIVHQVNLEFLGQLAMTRAEGTETIVYPDTLIGTDSHTTMINGLGVLGWGVGGIEAEAGLLGQPSSMLIPQVIGFELSGELPPGATATDLVLTITQMLRVKGVVGKFVEFYGDGLKALSLADRATISNMSPEFGTTCAIFPIDQTTLDYLVLTGRKDRAELAKAYYQAQGLWYPDKTETASFTDQLKLDLGTVQSCLAGPARPQDRVSLSEVRGSFEKAFPKWFSGKTKDIQNDKASVTRSGETFDLKHGSVVIAAITSCTNTSNPTVLVTAGLLARNAVKKGLKAKPWVKTSLAPGSKVVTDYLTETGLMKDLEALNFHLVGYGCTTCIGNSGPLPEEIASAITSSDLAVSSVLSGNRNFEGRINPLVRANYLASPPLVVAYALAGSTNVNLEKDPIGKDNQGKDVYLKDLWPKQDEIRNLVQKHVTPAQFQKSYADVFQGSKEWTALKVPKDELYQWDSSSTYIKEPPFFEGITKDPAPVQNIEGARVLALLGDSVTTDHISPAGSIGKNTPAGKYLLEKGIQQKDFNSYGARRGNHEVMMRGTFANIRIRNLLAPGTEGGFTRYLPTGEQMTIFEAAQNYQKDNTPLIILAGKEYGTGSSRDWAAKGTRLLGARAVIAESFERIHRSNLVGMGVLPLEFKEGTSVKSLGLTGEESFAIDLGSLTPGGSLKVTAQTLNADGSKTGNEVRFETTVRIDTPIELSYFNHGGILPFVLRQMLHD